ncbi:MAG: tripartite tricarboxylate transporter substrate binding protein, partial [Betaproteobacteria bacterium]|nr:tripartite tricarboxylate transporter substrate binding protein [Betaproteobacteria bacterium]
YEWITWFGLLAPAQTPKPVITRLNAALVEVVRAPDIKSQFEILGYNAVGSSPEEFAAFIRAESRSHAKAAKLSGVKVD